MKVDIMPLGDRALLINFQQKIDPDIHQLVMNLSVKIDSASIEGVTFVLPAYCSLTVGYDPEKINYGELKPAIMDLWSQQISREEVPSRAISLPVCYQQPYALDLLELSKISGLTQKELIRLHTEASYRVYMLGFLPGFPYLGILPKLLRFPRCKNPRIRIPERSVGIAGEQTGIYPSESPGGWNILGSTPLPVFNRHNDTPFLFKTGDMVQFRSIPVSEYQQIEVAVENQSFNWDSIYE